MIVEGVYTSVWDGGIEVSTPCKVNLVTKEVFDIETADVEGLETLDREYVTVDGKEHSVGRTANEPSDAEFWYD